MVCLIAIVDGKEYVFPLPPERASIGRAVENDVVLPRERGVSKHHAVLERTAEGRYLLSNDRRSKNGIFVGTERVDSVLLDEPGTVASLGAIQLTIGEGESEEVRPSFAIEPVRRREPDTEVPEPLNAETALDALSELVRARRNGSVSTQQVVERLRRLLGAASVQWIRIAGNEIALRAAAGDPVNDAIPDRLRQVDVSERWIERIGDVSVIASISEHRRVRDVVFAAVGGPPRRFAAWEKSAFETITTLMTQRRSAMPERTAPPSPIEIPSHFIVHSQAMRDLVERAMRRPRATDAILLIGETGTGKEVIANLLHRSGPFANGAFVARNCAELTETLAASELFGIGQGVATGVEASEGLFRAANEGTIFFDEIGDLSDAMQAKLLRAIGERSVTTVGGTTATPLRLRIIAATNRPESLREDLRNRFAFPLRVPPLRDRRDDIVPLLMHFVERECLERGIPPVGVSRKAVRRLCDYNWPGNVRQLMNVVANAVGSAHGGETLQAEQFELDPADAKPPRDDPRSAGEKLDAYERELMIESLQRRKTLQEVADDFGRSREWLRQRMRALGIAPTLR